MKVKMPAFKLTCIILIKKNKDAVFFNLKGDSTL